MNKTVMLVSCLLALPLGAAAGDIYRWKDHNGRWHFSEQPPGAGVTFEKVAPPPDSGAGTSPNRDELSAYSGAGDAARAESAVQRAEQEKLVAEKRDRCKSAQERLALLESRPPVRWAKVDASGELARMTEEQYAAEQAKARQKMAENCGRT